MHPAFYALPSLNQSKRAFVREALFFLKRLEGKGQHFTGYVVPGCNPDPADWPPYTGKPRSRGDGLSGEENVVAVAARVVGVPYSMIAGYIGCHRSTILRALRKYHYHDTFDSRWYWVLRDSLKKSKWHAVTWLNIEWFMPPEETGRRRSKGTRRRSKRAFMMASPAQPKPKKMSKPRSKPKSTWQPVHDVNLAWFMTGAGSAENAATRKTGPVRGRKPLGRSPVSYLGILPTTDPKVPDTNDGTDPLEKSKNKTLKPKKSKKKPVEKPAIRPLYRRRTKRDGIVTESMEAKVLEMFGMTGKQALQPSDPSSALHPLAGLGLSRTCPEDGAGVVV